MNTFVDPDDHPWYGIPFPGSYVLDEEGLVLAKFFEGNLGVRANSDELLRAAMGEDVELAMPAASAGEVTAAVDFDGEVLSAIVRHDLVMRLDIPDGQHVYADPAPTGMVALTIEFDDLSSYGLGTLRSPEPHEHHLEGTDEVFPVHDGFVELRQPLVYLGGGFEDLGYNAVTVSGRVRWQACDDLACGLPAEQRFEFTLPTAKAVMPHRAENDGDGMDFTTHFARMTERRKS